MDFQKILNINSRYLKILKPALSYVVLGVIVYYILTLIYMTRSLELKDSEIRQFINDSRPTLVYTRPNKHTGDSEVLIRLFLTAKKWDGTS
jgi:hypothetical protein